MKRSLWLISLLLIAVVWFLAAQPVQAQAPDPLLPEGPTVCTAQGTSYRSTFTAVEDSYVKNTTPDTNYGTDTGVVVGLVTGINAATYHTLVAFDLSTLPADAVILTATLELYQTYSSGTFSMKAQVLTSAWTEDGVIWNNLPTHTTANEVSGGALSDGWRRWNLTTIAQQWRSGLANHGVRVVFDTGTSGSRVFSAREGANPPRLVVEYVRRTTLTVLADTQVSQANLSANSGNASPLYIARNGVTETHALLSFNVSGVPAGSTIISASLGLYPYFALAQAPTAPQALSIASEAILSTWNEMVVTWNTAPGSAGQGDPSKLWADAVWNWFDVTNIAQGWASGALVNHGIKLKPAVGFTGSAPFEAIPNTNRARLIITYGPPPCYPATSVTIGGATQGVTNQAYGFNASILPTTATLPILYTWRADEQSTFESYVGAITYTWATTGTKTITVTASNCESSVVDTHQVVINAPAPACPNALAGLTLGGPTTGFTGTQYTYTATPAPANATTPITYTWQATGQSNYTGPQAMRNYTWATPGVKTITVTARNCGGEIVQHYTVNVQPRPDLVISGAWYNLAEKRVYYIVKNVGGGTAPAGHTVTLSRNGTPVASAIFNEALPPGATRAGSIAHEWMCAGATAQMRVCADATGVIPENDEANNCFQETWACDLTPPQITSGPTVSAIGETGATISWTTNEPCRSRLDYGRNGPFNIQSVPDNVLKTNHQVVLAGLNSGSLYWYNVAVTDAAGNLNTSGGAFFETQPVGTDPVAIGTSYGLMDYPSTLYEFFTLYADVTSDPAGVDRVSFFLDGQLVGRDHSPTGNRFEVYVSPAALGMSRADWYKQHALQVQAYNLQNAATAVLKQVTPVSRQATGNVVFVSPGAGKNIMIDGTTAPAGTMLDVMVYGVEYKWKCTEAPYAAEIPPGLDFVDCGDVLQSVSTMKLYLDSVQVGGEYVPPAGVFHRTFNVSLGDKSAGTHTLRFEALSFSGRTYTAERQIELTQGRGDLAFGRRVTCSGNVFNVTLTISNTGTGTAYVDYVDDFARGFQVVEKASQQGRLVSAAGVAMPSYNYYAITGNDWGDAPERKFRIDLYADGNAQEMILGPGEAFAIDYQLVPILYPQWEFYYIGSGHNSAHSASIKYRFLGVQGTFTEFFQANGNWIGGVYIDVAVQQATATADYILVTSPAGLRQYTTPIDWRTSAGTQRELNLLLSRMAELASLKQGVLGFLPINPCAATLDALLEPGGRWANAMHPDFRGYEATGYVLFVGEDEIIPPQAAAYKTTYSDLRYASTSGQAKPELILGRIVGGDLGTLSNALRTSIMFHKTGSGFDRSHALGVSGTDEDSDREFDVFWGDIKGTASTFANSGGFNVTKIRWATDNAPTKFDVFKNAVAATSPDVIFYSGHGSPSGWSGLATWNIPSLNFGLSRPIGLSFACSTGDYRDSYSMPEAWLRYNGSVFIGSTSSTYDYPDSNAIRKMASYWPLSAQDRNIGQVFTYIKRHKWAGDSEWRMFAYQYHLFGDPKYGAITTLAQSSSTLPALPAATQPVTMLQVTIPDFDVTVTDTGLDAVEIPGGETWGRAYEYRVPYWIESVDYAPGQRVQDVVLTAQAGLVITTGLHLPTTTPEIRCPDCAPLASTAAVTPTWFPALGEPYHWQITENPDGSSTLDVTIYPFYYYSPTTDVRFYKDWSFNVDVFPTTVDIVTLNPTQATYRLTETVAANLVVNNSGAAQPILVQPVVKSLSDEVQTALTLRALHAVTGTSMLDLAVPALPAGDYYLDVTLLDMAGHVLDTEVTEFTVGVAAGEVKSLSAAPALFKPGDNIALAMTFKNTGDVTLNGVAVLRVQTADGITQAAEFTHTFSALAPGATATINKQWNSSGATGEDYRVVGYVTYNLGVSAPREVALSTRARVYLPLVIRN